MRRDQANGGIFLPKLGWLCYRNSRDVLGEVRNATVSQSGGKGFVSIQTQREVAPSTPNGGAVGIDMGIARFATLSDGSFFAPLNSCKQHKAALRKVQRSMSHKTKLSNNGKKAKARVQCIHARIWQCPPRLPAQSHDNDQPKPRDGVYRGYEGAEHVQVVGRERRAAGKTRSRQVWFELGHSRSMGFA